MTAATAVAPAGVATGYQFGVSTGPPPTPTSWTAGLWVAAVLALAGLPVNTTNVNNMLMWLPFENNPATWDTRNNPLNASLGTSAGDGTAGYPNLAVAAYYTARMLMQKNMGSIYQALSQSAAPAAFSAAVVSAPWAGSHYGVAAAGAPAKYVVAGRGMDYLTKGTPLPGSTPASSSTAGTPTDNIPGSNVQLTSVWSTVGTVAGDLFDPFGAVGAAGGAAASAAGGVVSSADALGTLALDLTSAAFWKRIGVFTLGGALVTVGLVVFFLSTKPGQELTETAAMAAVA